VLAYRPDRRCPEKESCTFGAKIHTD